ncbi:hypothetical protein [uncultured Desulfosarcina sp.]|uniref:hypothetical protein n=1 Tax=uncultured Desulfosarcina sp. TaxID=218289 RepID=UPI0029C6B1B9|nr:hypothetical protein [uncultured Desulfosarcina sp.]
MLPEKLLISDVTEKRQFARTPFACAFQSGWLDFMFATVHIYYGNASKKPGAYRRRVKAFASVAQYLVSRAKQEGRVYILVGDFNIEKIGDATADALAQANFTIVRNEEGSNRTQTKFYDPISFWAREGEMRMANADRANGVLRLFVALFRDEDFPAYDSDVDATLAARWDTLIAEQLALEARKPSKTHTEELKTVAEKWKNAGNSGLT